MTECCNEFGGVITIEAGDLRLSARGDVTLEPFNFERTVEAGHDGRTYGVRRPKPYRASFSYSRPCHLDDLQS
ncbi:MAG TPA: hypothetical protein ENJ83_05910, partial [Rhodospirillales bacterium]|nr:hypothetical protein [Rhodospirillales bacterium]